MKNLFTMTLVALMGCSLGADAQNYRKWDFTQWSAQTIANLAADAAASSTVGWSDIEKRADAGEGKTAPEATAGKCYWLDDNTMSELTANGVTITETEGLIFNTAYSGNRSLAIAVDYPSTSLGTYAGPQYLWLGGGGKNVVCFTIPKVRIGQKMTFVVESHKPSDTRGIGLYVGSISADNLIGEQFKPTTQATKTWEEGWQLPEGATDNGDGTVDIIVYNTSGCHLYSIEIGDSNEKSKVAFLYGGNLDADLAYAPLSGSEKYTVEAIQANKAFTLADMQDYDAMIISSTVENAEAIASLKAIRPFVSTLNLNPSLYEAWGVGSVQTAEAQFADVKQPNHALFRGLELYDEDEEGIGLMITMADSYQAVTLSGDFADDAVLATVMGNDEQIAIHGHSLSRNAYIYLPLTQEALAAEGNIELLINAVTVVANTKAKVSQAPAPTISLAYGDRTTTVTLRSTVPMAEIFYTLDGSEPTEASTPYTEPIIITDEGITIKAVARGEGFLMSDAASQEVDIKTQAAAPTISVDGNTVTISTTEADGIIYYNYSNSNEIGKSSPYTEPVVVKKSRTIYAFVAAEGKLNSELASAEVTVEGSKVRTNILAHMDANKEEYYAKGNQRNSTTSYYFSWERDKAAYSFYNVDAGYTEETVIDPETGDETTIRTYNEMNPEEEVDFENGWLIRSRGQLVIWEGQDTRTDIGDTSYRNPATVEDMDADFPVTRYFINLADKNTTPSDASFPYNAYIVSTQKFKGPFDIVANIGNGNSETAKFTIVLQTSVDGNQWESNWETVGDTIILEVGNRLYKNFTRSYNGSDEVYVRAYLADNNSKAQFYDIYIANNPNEGDEPALLGDVNGDGAVDVADISAIISVMAGTATYGTADVNGDGSVDVADISSVITIMAQ